MQGSSNSPAKVVFSDINAYYGQDSTNSYILVYNENSINNLILSALTTRFGCRIFNRRLGSRTNSILFDPIDERTTSRLKSEIQSCLDLISGVMKLDTPLIVLPDYEKQQYYVEINYSIPALMNKNVSLNFNLNKMTG